MCVSRLPTTLISRPPFLFLSNHPADQPVLGEKHAMMSSPHRVADGIVGDREGNDSCSRPAFTCNGPGERVCGEARFLRIRPIPGFHAMGQAFLVLPSDEGLESHGRVRRRPEPTWIPTGRCDCLVLWRYGPGIGTPHSR